MRFLDTNILLYAISKDGEEASKAEVARELLRERDLALSAQVLQEFYVQATRESRPDRIAHEQAVALIETFRRYPIQETTTELVLAAATVRERFRISYWDAAIIEAARLSGCETLLSEDLSDGQDYAGVWVSNPFR
ncbi:MAG TPA: PIN domain-containing protein [Solirubrobacteraceae bacterium]|nr:PIN domain-containing protein [Solirubrobacteraceae bacterium]